MSSFYERDLKIEAFHSLVSDRLALRCKYWMYRNVNGYRFTKYHWCYKRSRDGALRPGFDSRVSHVGWVCCWFSSLLKGFKFLRVFWFSSLRKKKQTNKQAKNKKKQSKFDLEAEDKKKHLVEWPLLNSHSPSHYSRCFKSCVYQLRLLVDSNGRTACNHKGGRGLGPGTEPQTVLSSPALSLLWPAHYK